jgi:hypothetical protein
MGILNRKSVKDPRLVSSEAQPGAAPGILELKPHFGPAGGAAAGRRPLGGHQERRRVDFPAARDDNRR